MPGQCLMCVWETASLMCPAEGQTAPECQTLKALSITMLRDSPCAKFFSSMFEEMFYKKDVTFDKFKTYVRQCVEDKSVPFSRMEDFIEAKCWLQCKDLYNVKATGLDEASAKQLWQIYVRLVEIGSYPPVVFQEDMDWFAGHMESSLSQHAEPSSSLTESLERKATLKFQEFLAYIMHKFAGRYNDVVLNHTIEEMHSWLVQEISMAGWLYKRKRKQGNWTSWLQRWFILTPGKLTYYEGPKCEVKKGEVSITSKSVLEEVRTQKRTILFKKAGSVFKLSNLPYIETEMSAANETENKAWIVSIRDMIESSKLGSTLVQMLLAKRRLSQVDEPELKLGEIKARSSSVKRISRGWYEYDNTQKNPDPHLPLQLVPSSLDGEDFGAESKEKIRALFNGCDANGNGYIDRAEFRKFIKEFGHLDLDADELDEVYDTIDRDSSDSLTFDEFYSYFIKFILTSSYETSFVENKLKIEFLKADRTETAAFNFKDLVEATHEQNRNQGRDSLEATFNEMAESGNGDVPLEEIKHLLHVCDDGPEMPSSKNKLERRLKSMYKKTELNNIAGYIKERWNKFSSFKRYGASGDLVMKGSSGMVADVLPGQYNLLDLACFSEDESIQPKRVVIKGAKWVKSPDPGQSGMLIFPSDYDGSIPVDIATSGHARYYGCHLADSTQLKVSLLYRHGIQDFTYQNNYLNDYVEDKNGPGLEMHEFSHLDCPLEDDSGYFILGKLVQGMKHEELHLTAFIVPTRHTLYVSANTIHSNDYLKGTWRTMLSDEADIDHYHVVKGSNNNIHNAPPKSFTFKMTGRYANLSSLVTTKL